MTFSVFRIITSAIEKEVIIEIKKAKNKCDKKYK